MRSGRLAGLTGVSTDTLRHYERVGLLVCPPRTGTNYRDYAPSCRERVDLIQRALRIGFSLAELKRILAVRDRGGAPCAQVRALLESKIGDLTRRIKELRLLRVELNRLSKVWDKRLSASEPEQPSKLLESLVRQDKVTVSFRRSAWKNRKGR